VAENPLPGSQTSNETAQGADNDYYFAGIYTNALAGNGIYTPVGLVAVHEEAAERGFTGADNELRYHFNLPNTVQPTDLVAVAFDALNLDTTGSDPRYGVEAYVNGVLVQSEVLIRAAQLDQEITASFTPANVNAQLGLGHDNIVTLRGISYSTAGGGSSLGIDYVRIKGMPPAAGAALVGGSERRRLADRRWRGTQHQLCAGECRDQSPAGCAKQPRDRSASGQ
jgi:hypothetical protein